MRHKSSKDNTKKDACISLIKKALNGILIKNVDF